MLALEVSSLLQNCKSLIVFIFCIQTLQIIMYTNTPRTSVDLFPPGRLFSLACHLLLCVMGERSTWMNYYWHDSNVAVKPDTTKTSETDRVFRPKKYVCVFQVSAVKIVGMVDRHDIWAPSSEFVSSSIPSWQMLNAHDQPFIGARDLAFCLNVPLDSLLIWASSEGSGETARMRRLAWTSLFA